MESIVMKKLNNLKLFVLTIVGFFSVSTAFAYDDIYASTKKGEASYSEKRQKSAEAKRQKEVKEFEEIQKKASSQSDDMIVVKNSNLKQYVFSSK